MASTFEICFTPHYNLGKLNAVKNTTKLELYRRLLLARNYIDANISKPITLEAAASEACLSKFHFMRLFKQAFGLTVHQYITQTRLQHAKAALETELTSFAEICRKMGYEDVAWFAKVYKRTFGVSPVRYAKIASLKISHQQSVMAVA